jgi:uncharacterized protein YciI
MKKAFKSIAVLLVLFIGVQQLTAQATINYFFVFLNTNPDKPQISEEETERLQALHLENLDKLAADGILHAAGPFEGGGGMLVLSAGSMEEAKEIVNTDPAVNAQRFNVEVFPFQVIGNNICGAKEPYEMVTYQFVRLTSNVEFFGDMQKMVYDNRYFLARENNEHDHVVVYGSFSDFNDGMIIFDLPTSDEAEKIIKQHPAVQEGQLNYEIKPLWIAKGTFCKK